MGHVQAFHERYRSTEREWGPLNGRRSGVHVGRLTRMRGVPPPRATGAHMVLCTLEPLGRRDNRIARSIIKLPLLLLLLLIHIIVICIIDRILVIRQRYTPTNRVHRVYRRAGMYRTPTPRHTDHRSSSGHHPSRCWSTSYAYAHFPPPPLLLLLWLWLLSSTTSQQQRLLW